MQKSNIVSFLKMAFVFGYLFIKGSEDPPSCWFISEVLPVG